MNLFAEQINEIHAYLFQKQREGKISELIRNESSGWPQAKRGNIVLSSDTAVELGNPKDASTSFLLWQNSANGSEKTRIILVGPDLPEIRESYVPFGKITIINGTDFDADNCYKRYRRLEQIRYNIHLSGYMMRGVSQFQREWSRVSRKAIKDGFSLRHLGAALIEKYLKLKFVRSVKLIFITTGTKDVLRMKTVGDKVIRIIAAMNKMTEDISFDCSSCEYQSVCRDVAELRSMRKKLIKKRRSNQV